MKSEEYNWAIAKAKAARLRRQNNPADPAARVAFERDFATLVDDTPVEVSRERCDELLSIQRERKAG